MPVYEVTKIAPEPKPWTAQGKYPMLEYRIDLKGPNAQGETVDVSNVEWSRKAESPAPAVGQRLNVEKFEDRGQRGLKLHLVQQGSPTGSYSARNGSSRDFKADPVKQAAIAMEASQKAAVEMLRITSERGWFAYDDPESNHTPLWYVTTTAQSLFEQIQQAMREAEK